MMQRWAEARASIRKSVLFWWILFVVMQMAERVFLLRDAFEQEAPSLPLLLKTLVVGVRGISLPPPLRWYWPGSGQGHGPCGGMAGAD